MADDLAGFIDIVQKVGAGGAVLLGYLFISERNERIKAQDALAAQSKENAAELLDIAKEATGAIRDTANAVDKITEGAGENRAAWTKIADAISTLANRRR